MSVLQDIVAACKGAQPHIVLSEGNDPRIIDAARRASAEGLARVTLIGQTPVEGVTVIDPATSDLLDRYAAAFHDLRKHKGVSEAGAREAMTAPLGFAAMMVRLGDADGTIGGAVNTTSDVVRTA